MATKHTTINKTIWNDETFRTLSSPQPNAQSLLIYLMTAKESGIIPGLFEIRKGTIIDRFNWNVKDFDKVCRELINKGLIEVDWNAGLVWIPTQIYYNKPPNPNVVKAWKKAWNELPKCRLKYKCYKQIIRFLKPFPKPFQKPFLKRSDLLIVNNCSFNDNLKINLNTDSKIVKKVNPVKKQNKLKNRDDKISDKRDFDKIKRLREQTARRQIKPNNTNGSSKKLFQPKSSIRSRMLQILKSKPRLKERKKIQNDLEKQMIKEFIRVYKSERYKTIGSAFYKDVKSNDSSALKLSILCLELQRTPEDVVRYWIDNNFTKMKFPTLSFMAADKNVETISAELVRVKKQVRRRAVNGRKQTDHNHSFSGELDDGLKVALKDGGFTDVLKLSDRQIMSYQVAAKSEKKKPGRLTMGKRMKEVIEFLNEYFYTE